MTTDSAESTAPAARPGSRSTWAVGALVALALSFIALAMCDYRFAAEDQLQYLAHAVELEHPGTFAGDPYMRAFEILRSVFWNGIVAVSDEASRPAVCLALALGLGAIGGLVLMRLGTVLTTAEARGVNLIAGTAAVMVFVVPKEQNWFGLVSLTDVELTATSAVVPLVLGAMLAWVAGRPVLTLVLAAATAPLHAQTSAYLMAAWVVASVWRWRRSPKWLALPAVVALGGLVAVLRERASNTVTPENLDALERAGRTMYGELIDPWTSPWSAWGAVFALLALGVASAVALERRLNPLAAHDAQRRAIGWGFASLAFPAGGMLLLLLDPREPLLWRIMVGRSFMIPQIAALALFAAWTVVTMRRGGGRAVTAAISLILITWWPFPDWPRPAAAAGIAVIVGLVAADALRPRDPGSTRVARFAAIAVSGAAAILAVVGAFRFAERPYAWLDLGMPASWRGAQQWAREHTPPGSRFLTPPNRPGWRIESHRPTFGELNDGGLFFYAGEESIAWMERMDRLGLPPKVRVGDELGAARYAEALATIGDDWLGAHGIDYVVTERARDVALGDEVWSNDDFVIRKVR